MLLLLTFAAAATSPARGSISAPSNACFAAGAAQTYREYLVNADIGTGEEKISPQRTTPAEMRSSLPLPGPDQLFRAATLVNHVWYVVDKGVDSTSCELTTRFYTVATTTGVETTQLEATQTAAAGQLETAVTAPSGRTVSSSTELAAGPCQACDAGGTVSRAAFPFLCGPAAPACVVGMVFDELNGTGCGAVNCADESAPGMLAASPVCGLSDCHMEVMVYAGPGRATRSVCDSIQWIYPPGTAALHNGSLATQVGDDACSPGRTNVFVGNNEEYQYTHYASDPQWTACASHLTVSITVQFTDFNFITTGWQAVPKQSVESTCPGWRVVP
jgi:hypothetical protein